MRKEYSVSKLIKIASLVYTALTGLFFLLMNLGAGYMKEAIEQAEAAGTSVEDITFTGFKLAVVVAVNILVYVELFGYFAILFMVFLYYQKRTRYTRFHQPMPENEKFPTAFFIIGLVCFLIFMSMMGAVL